MVEEAKQLVDVSEISDDCNKQAIWDADDIHTVPVPVPEWRQTVYIGVMTGAAREVFEGECFKQLHGNDGVSQHVRASLVQKCARDKQNRPLFDVADVPRLSAEKSSLVLHRLYQKCQEVNCLREEDLLRLGKPSGETQDDNTSSGSQDDSGAP